MDMTGKKIGRLTFLARAPIHKDGRARWLCSCDCGKSIIVRATDIRARQAGSCGCKRRETRHGYLIRRHPLGRTWQGIRDRCLNPRCRGYKNYGGRGITMHAPWSESFDRFAADMVASIGLRPGRAYSLDRIDNDGPYAPGNLRWATSKQQSRNRRRPRNHHKMSFATALLSMGV